MINFPFVSGKNLKEGFEPSRRGKTKNALPLNSETKRLKTLCGTTLLAGPLAERGHSRLPLQADGITPVTRPRLLASSFSRRLQGDFHRRACPPRTKRRLSLQTFDRLLFLFFANYSITGLSYHILTVCQLIYAEKAAEFAAFSKHILFISHLHRVSTVFFRFFPGKYRLFRSNRFPWKNRPRPRAEPVQRNW